ncbi:hypothetical protein G5B31_14020 [Rhodobacter sp. SGA-6-6]|uniref:hypothetical protein n=1 Tax=Rhodobacter sp. SGA-6-6 TaxID=2710882 RepID=UPI0013E9E992|nr:hypothetical protein [Rhodobacter sp. SGA-6-6]NGM46653.1 hypothetical protein [Rhodobacter sp. SGA-6-6]
MRTGLAALLLAAPAPLAAESLDCLMQHHCMTGDGCADLAEAAAMRLELAADRASGRLGVGEVQMELRLLARHERGDTFLAEAPGGGSIGVLTLAPDGRFLTSSHEFGMEPILVTAGTGTCTPRNG